MVNDPHKTFYLLLKAAFVKNGLKAILVKMLYFASMHAYICVVLTTLTIFIQTQENQFSNSVKGALIFLGLFGRI